MTQSGSVIRALAGSVGLCATGALAFSFFRYWQRRHRTLVIEKELETGETLIVRPGSEKDSEVIHGMVKRLAEFERMPEAVETTPQTLSEDYKANQYWTAIAELNGRPVGFALFFPIYSTWEGRSIHLEDLYILEGDRSKGVGLVMLQYVAKFAEARGCARVEWAALDWNVKAHDFYERLGANKMPEWIKFRLDRRGIQKVAYSC
ncbi:Diamine acetyltransferase 2 [Perkinsus chesapeaki]|uniref:Diamine acetyltransferase 2 n=1 Tax=Perkinsus chesapeaki TaxID=330153 RepID=A0A7J6LHQ7_PERCH|nr:Diamine acetyltransferase 2 [Perkinsus chesapeaki]